MKQVNIRTPLVFRLGVVLLCAMLITFSMMSGLYARYSTTVTGEASAQVAKFDVQVSGDDSGVSVDVSQATDNVYTITIKNDSEVTVQYGLSVSNIDGVSVTFDSNSDTLGFGQSVVCNLTFTVTDWDLITKNMDDENKSISIPFTITVNIEQVD